MRAFTYYDIGIQPKEETPYIQVTNFKITTDFGQCLRITYTVKRCDGLLNKHLQMDVALDTTDPDDLESLLKYNAYFGPNLTLLRFRHIDDDVKEPIIVVLQNDIEPFAQGAFNKVYRAVTTWPQYPVVLKIWQGNGPDHPKKHGHKYEKTIGHLTSEKCPEPGRKNKEYAIQKQARTSLDCYLEKTPYVKDKRMQLAVNTCLEVDKIHFDKITHRDLKPENILIDGKYRLRLTDFDFSEENSDFEKCITKTKGTPKRIPPSLSRNYTAYEQDIFALKSIFRMDTTHLSIAMIDKVKCIESYRHTQSSDELDKICIFTEEMMQEDSFYETLFYMQDWKTAISKTTPSASFLLFGILLTSGNCLQSTPLELPDNLRAFLNLPVVINQAEKFKQIQKTNSDTRNNDLLKQTLMVTITYEIYRNLPIAKMKQAQHNFLIKIVDRVISIPNLDNTLLFNLFNSQLTKHLLEELSKNLTAIQTPKPSLFAEHKPCPKWVETCKVLNALLNGELGEKITAETHEKFLRQIDHNDDLKAEYITACDSYYIKVKEKIMTLSL